MPQRPIRTVIHEQQFLVSSPQTTVAEAACLMRDGKAGALIITDQNRIVGVFTERDALFRVIAEGRDPGTTHLHEVMTPDPETIDPDKPLGHALHMMYEGGFRNVPVVEHEKPVGIVSVRDALGPELKQFVSELDQRERISKVMGY